eukprot:m.110042 g.110042  ORF g.110042 m.110042 type:complete len:105 (+) comp15261_c0_seq2:74-388(+)
MFLQFFVVFFFFFLKNIFPCIWEQTLVCGLFEKKQASTGGDDTKGNEESDVSIPHLRARLQANEGDATEALTNAVLQSVFGLSSASSSSPDIQMPKFNGIKEVE